MPEPKPWNPESGHTLYEDRKLWIDYARELKEQNKHDDNADTLCRNLLCEERDTAEVRVKELEIVINRLIKVATEFGYVNDGEELLSDYFRSIITAHRTRISFLEKRESDILKRSNEYRDALNRIEDGVENPRQIARDALDNLRT